MYSEKVKAFEECIIHTLVRILTPHYENLTVLNCFNAESFREDATNLLETNSLFKPFNPYMHDAKINILSQL